MPLATQFNKFYLTRDWLIQFKLQVSWIANLHQSFLFTVFKIQAKTPTVSPITQTVHDFLKISNSLCGFRQTKTPKVTLSVLMMYSSQMYSMGEGGGIREIQFYLKVYMQSLDSFTNLENSDILSFWESCTTKVTGKCRASFFVGLR